VDDELAPEGQRLIAAVRGALDDERPAMVLADWLDEQGDGERAAWIRLQHRRLRLPSADPQQPVIDVEEQALWEACVDDWFAALALPDGARPIGTHRGFGLSVAVEDLAQIPDVAAACAAFGRPLSSVYAAIEADEPPAPLDEVPGLRALTIEFPLDDVRVLTEGGLAQGLRALTLRDVDIEPALLTELVSATALDGLQMLRLPGEAMSSAFVAALTARERRIAHLDLSAESLVEAGIAEGDLLQDADLQRLAEWPSLAHVRWLDLSGAQVGLEGLSALLRSPYAAGLRGLGITPTTAEALDALHDAHPEMRLERLEAGDVALAPMAPALVGAACLASLEHLALRRVGGPDEAWRRLAAAPWLSQLAILDASGSPLSCVRGLLDGGGAQALHTLVLRGSLHVQSSDPDLLELVQLQALDGLLVLDLRNNYPGWQGIYSRLGEVARLPGLLTLRLSDPRTVSSALAPLAGSAFVRRLRAFDCGDEDLERLPEWLAPDRPVAWRPRAQ
jgi:uncharacterized protein (TIGR02996 family)